MSRERLYLFDTTLRDGAQTNGVDFTLADKQVIAHMLDDLGIDYVEGGYPGANPTDTEFFADKPKLAHSRFSFRVGISEQRFALPQRSPSPFRVPWIWRAPARTAANEFATACSVSLWAWMPT